MECLDDIALVLSECAALSDNDLPGLDGIVLLLKSSCDKLGSLLNEITLGDHLTDSDSDFHLLHTIMYSSTL